MANTVRQKNSESPFEKILVGHSRKTKRKASSTMRFANCEQNQNKAKIQPNTTNRKPEIR